MEAKEFIESGILELYVYGLLNETEIAEVQQMAKQQKIYIFSSYERFI